MRRPAAIIAVTFGSGIVVADYVIKCAVIWLIAATASLTAAVYILLKEGETFRRILAVFFCGISLGGVYYQINDFMDEPVDFRDGQYIEVCGIIKEISNSDAVYDLIVSGGGSKVMVKYYSKEPLPGDCKGQIVNSAL